MERAKKLPELVRPDKSCSLVEPGQPENFWLAEIFAASNYNTDVQNQNLVCQCHINLEQQHSHPQLPVCDIIGFENGR